MLKVRDFMSRNVETIDADAPIEAAMDKMFAKNIQHLVVTRDGQPAGILSQHDIGGKEQQAAHAGRSVAEIMTPQVVSVSSNATVREAANQMRGRAVGCLPVFDDKRLVGIITIADLLELLGRGLQRPAPKGERPSLQRHPLNKKWAEHTHAHS